MLVKFDTLLLWCLVQVCILCMQGGLSSPLTSLGRKAVSSSLSIAPSFFKSCDYQLYSPKLKQEVALSSLVNSCKEQGQRGSLLLFLTHAGDLSSFELTQQLLHYQAQLGDVNIVTIMPGATSANAEQFCTLTKLPAEKLYVDRSTNLYRELSFGGGFLHSQRQLVPAYLRLLPMLMGVGSPGTIQEVLRGYVGDRSAPSAWIKRSLR